MEARSVTGPAKNLIEFYGVASRCRAACRIEPTVATFHRGQEPASNAFLAALSRAGVPFDIIAERRVFDLAVVPQLRAIVAARRPAVIQTHSVKSHFLVRLSGIWRRIPWIAFHHGYTSTDAKGRIYNQLDRWSLRRARQIVTVSRAFAKELENRGVPAGRIAVQHNMIGTFQPCLPQEVASVRRQFGVPCEALLLLAVGRLSREKGHLDLIDAFAALRRLCPEKAFCMVLVGEGPERFRIERKCGQLGIADSVFLVGHQNDVRPFYSMADIVVLPSHSEGSPNVLLEAMAAGLPVVATVVGGVPEIATDGRNALLVPKMHPAQMAHALARLVEDRELAQRLGTAAREVVLRHTPEAYHRSLSDIYTRVAVHHV